MSSRRVSFPSAEVVHAFGVIFPFFSFPLQMVMRKLTHASSGRPCRGSSGSVRESALQMLEPTEERRA
jgi:hypothetical protein